MEYQLDFVKVKKFVEKKGAYTYKRTHNTFVLPFPTRNPERVKFSNGFGAIVGAVLRTLNGEKLEFTKDQDTLSLILSEGKFDTEETEKFFQLFVENELNEIENANISRIQYLKNIPFIDDVSERKGEKDLFRFFYDSFIRDTEEEFIEIFQSMESADLLSDIINISISEEADSFKAVYKPLFPKLRKNFLADVRTMATNPAFCVQNLTDLALHYCFIAMAQTIIQTNKFTKADYGQLHRVVFVIQSESVSKWRDFYNEGFRLLKEEVKEFLAHEHVLNVLGNNTFVESNNWFYADYANYFKHKDTQAEKQFAESIYNWLNEEYASYYTSTEKIPYTGQSLDEAFRHMYFTLRKNVQAATNSRYVLAFESIATKFYRKSGGPLGNVLALSLHQLLMLVAVSVGERGNKLELNKLWIEFEKRGVFLDKYSKLEVVKILDNLNYLDKKSDSGDAQYVKSIL